MRKARREPKDADQQSLTSHRAGCPFRLLHGNHSTTRDGACAECVDMTSDSLSRYQRQADYLRRTAGVADTSLSSDVVQQFVVDMALNGVADRFDPARSTSVETFCAGVNRRTFGKLLRARRKTNITANADLDDIGETDNSPYQSAVATERCEMLRAAIGLLPPRYREAICNAYGLAGMPDSASEGPDTPRNAMVLFRARRRLAAILRSQKRFSAMLDEMEW